MRHFPIVVASISMLAFANHARGDLPPVQIEFSNGVKVEGHLTECKAEYYWSDKLDQPYLQKEGDTHVITWKVLRMAEVKRLDLLPLTPAERQRIGKKQDWAETSKLPPTLIKANVTFRDGEVRKVMYIVLDTAWETNKETGDFHHPLLKSVTFDFWTCGSR